jgi:hypothetical protein
MVADVSSLVAFHRVLITAAIVFCFGFAVWEVRVWRATAATGAMALAATFLLLGIGLLLYLRRLNRILGYDRDR